MAQYLPAAAIAGLSSFARPLLSNVGSAVKNEFLPYAMKTAKSILGGVVHTGLNSLASGKTIKEAVQDSKNYAVGEAAKLPTIAKAELANQANQATNYLHNNYEGGSSTSIGNNGTSDYF